ncbi:hypothetical protein AB0I53_38110 [Saccharopolyspora sp. NPDC050389]
MKLYDGRRGYVHCRMTPEELVSEFKIVPTSPPRPPPAWTWRCG